MRVEGNYGAILGCKSNSYGSWYQPEFAELPLSLEAVADQWNHGVDENYYSQPGRLFRLFTSQKKALLFASTARTINDVPTRLSSATLATV